MKEKFKTILVVEEFRRIYLATFLIVIIQVSGILIFYKNLPKRVPLFYQLIWGEQQIAPVYYLWLIPFLYLFFIILNMIISIISLNMELKDYFVTKMLAYFLLITGIVSTYSLYKIITLFI